MKKSIFTLLLLLLSFTSFSQAIDIVEIPETPTEETYNGDVVYKRHIPINFKVGTDLVEELKLPAIKTITSMHIFSPMVTGQTQGKMELLVNFSTSPTFTKHINSQLKIKTIALMFNGTNNYLVFTYTNTYYMNLTNRYLIMIYYTKA